jgi:S1-C subfamily serine protease
MKCTLWPLLLAPVSFLVSKVPVIDAPGFSKEFQATAVTATVQIRNLTKKTDGSGVLIGKSAPFVYILTALHVVEEADRLEVAVFFKESFPRSKVVYRSAETISEKVGLTDLAVLRLATTDVMPGYVRLCPEGLVPTGQGMRVLTVGCDEGNPPTCLSETVAGKKLARRQEGGAVASFWEVDRKYVKGRSGGPLLDGRGYLLGVCSGTNREKTYFVHIEEIHGFLKRQGFRWLVEEK